MLLAEKQCHQTLFAFQLSHFFRKALINFSLNSPIARFEILHHYYVTMADRRELNEQLKKKKENLPPPPITAHAQAVAMENLLLLSTMIGHIQNTKNLI